MKIKNRLNEKDRIKSKSIFALKILLLILMFIALFCVVYFVTLLNSVDYRSAIKSPVKINKSATFLIAGDAMFDRLIYHQFKDKGLEHIFDNFGSRVFWGADLAMLNLEGPINPEPIDDNIDPDNLIFNFPPQTIEALKFLNINTVSLANNHTLNAGVSGLDNTKKMLQEAGIQYVGEPDTITETTVKRIKSAIPISVIAVNTLGQADLELEELIRKEKDENRFVIIFPHWGNEYQQTHSSGQEIIAHQWIDNGADLIVGAHPHVIQDFEIYNGKPIIYSLGNFVFDQTFSPETQQGLLLSGIITKDDITLTFFPTRQVNLMPRLMRGEEKLSAINNFLLDKTGFERVSDDIIRLKR